MTTAADLVGYHKVSQSTDCSLVSAIFWCPETDDERMEFVRDYEYSGQPCLPGGPTHDNDELYYMPIDEHWARVWRHKRGEILAGDVVRVAKGRTLPIGKAGVVKSIRPMRDRYQRWVADYVYFTDGSRINIDNVELVTAVNDYPPR